LTIERADVTLANQRDAALGFCRSGRLHPCVERRYWQAARAHYARLFDR
jgi:hypothetical protein